MFPGLLTFILVLENGNTPLRSDELGRFGWILMVQKDGRGKRTRRKFHVVIFLLIITKMLSQ